MSYKKLEIIAITSPWQFWTEISRVVFNKNTIDKIVIYWTRRQLENLFLKWWFKKEFLKKFFDKNKKFTRDNFSKENTEKWFLEDPFFPKEWWEIFNTIWEIPLEYTTIIKDIKAATTVIIWQNMEWISAEKERNKWEITTVKSQKEFISNNAKIISITKWISKNWSTASEELKNIFWEEKEINILAWPSVTKWLAESVYKWNEDKLFMNLAWVNWEKTEIKNILNKNKIEIYETSEVLWTELLWAFKNVFAFIYWILEWYWASVNQLPLFQQMVWIIVRNIFKELKIKRKITRSPAWNADFLLTCNHWRNWTFWKILWKEFRENENLKWEKLTKLIENKYEEFWKTVEWLKAAEWLFKRLERENISNKNLILIKSLVHLIEWKISFEKIYPFIVKNLKLENI